MANPSTTPLPVLSPEERVFPKLTPAQIARVAAHGRTRVVSALEVLVEPGDPVVPFFVVLEGEVEVLRPNGHGEYGNHEDRREPGPDKTVLVALHTAGQFSG